MRALCSWNYVTAFNAYIQPFPNWYVLGPNIKYFADHGVRGIFEEGSYGTPGGDMDALKDYVMGRMLWDVALDPDDLITEFLEGYFGPAAPFIRLYSKPDAAIGAIPLRMRCGLRLILSTTVFNMHFCTQWTQCMGPSGTQITTCTKVFLPMRHS
eukprot:SAG31_NODE_2443_length_5682_cov_3.662428_3_plen_155_part_00